MNFFLFDRSLSLQPDLDISTILDSSLVILKVHKLVQHLPYSWFETKTLFFKLKYFNYLLQSPVEAVLLKLSFTILADQMVFDLTFITYEFFRLVVSNMDRLEGLFLDGLIDVFYLAKKRVLRELRIRIVTSCSEI